MVNKILLTGEPKVGKSTITKKLVEQIGKKYCGGFYTEEIRTNNIRHGFRIVTLEGLSQVLADKNLESSLKIGNYGIDIEAINSLGVQAVKNAIAKKKIIIIDEIGPMQLVSNLFQEVIFDLINNHKMLIGTIVSSPHPVADSIKNSSHIQLIHITTRNRNMIVREIIENLEL